MRKLTNTALRSFTTELSKIAGTKDFMLRQAIHGFKGGNTLKAGQKSLVSELDSLRRSPKKHLWGGVKDLASSPVEAPLTALMLGMQAKSNRDAKKRGESKSGRWRSAGQGVGSLLGILSVRKSPFLPQMVATSALASLGGRIGSKLGKAADRRKRK